VLLVLSADGAPLLLLLLVEGLAPSVVVDPLLWWHAVGVGGDLHGFKGYDGRRVLPPM
jgi:hypothetical protein